VAAVLEPVLRMEHQMVQEPQLAEEHRKAEGAQLDHIDQVPEAGLRKEREPLVVVALRTAAVRMARPALVVAFAAAASVAACPAVFAAASAVAFELVQASAVRRFRQQA
jgi:hypothetical protein